MSTKEILYTMIEEMTEQQMQGLIMLLGGYSEPNEETAAAIEETRDMKLHPENYKSYDSAEEMLEDLLK